MTKHIAWLDLETDGSDDEREGLILEVGVVVSDMEFNVIDQFERVGYCHLRHLQSMPDVVQVMHQETGLWEEVQNSRLFTTDIDNELTKFFDQWPGEKLALAGSGVAHYDKKWVWWHLPKSAKHLTHWAYDIGSTRRILRDLAHVSLPGKVKGTAGVEHRALNDANAALMETQLYCTQLSTLRGWSKSVGQV